MRKVKDAVDLTTNEKIYFKGHAKATYLSDGRNVEEGISKKQDTITDLVVIREGASKGATALQSVPATYATKTDVSNAIQSAITNELNADF